MAIVFMESFDHYPTGFLLKKWHWMSGPAGAFTIANGAVCTATIASGAITAINLISGGNGYPPSLSGIPMQISGGGGSGCVATATSNSAGIIQAPITVVSPGSGYTSQPIITLTGPVGRSPLPNNTPGSCLKYFSTTSGGWLQYVFGMAGTTYAMVGVAIRFGVINSQFNFLTLTQSDGVNPSAIKVAVGINSHGQLILSDGTSGTLYGNAGTTVIRPNTWNYVELQVNHSSITYYGSSVGAFANVWLNSNSRQISGDSAASQPEIHYTGATLSAGTPSSGIPWYFDRVGIGCSTSTVIAPTDTTFHSFDDFYMCNNAPGTPHSQYPLGPISVTSLRPVTNTFNQLTVMHGQGTEVACVQNPTMLYTTYVETKQNAVDWFSYEQLPLPTSNYNSVYGIQIDTTTRRAAPVGNSTLKLLLQGSVPSGWVYPPMVNGAYPWTQIYPLDALTILPQIFEVYAPATAFTAAAVNSIQAGYVAQ